MNSMLEYAIALIQQYKNGMKIEEMPRWQHQRIDGLVSKMQKVSDQYKTLYSLANFRHSGRSVVTNIIIITDDIALSEVSENGNLRGYFPIVNGRVSSTYSLDKEGAILLALGEKYEGLNSDFAFYASKMLGRNTE